MFGARKGSLGAAIAKTAGDRGIPHRTYGITDDEHVNVEDKSSLDIVKDMARFGITDVVCTIGSNRPSNFGSGEFEEAMEESFLVNVTLPLRVLSQAIDAHANSFVVISSNSAHVARRGSTPYCASKAALSMAMRSIARERASAGMLIYGYEPGILSGTPMTEETAGGWTGALHRIPGLDPRKGLSVLDLASVIVDNVARPNRMLNGVMLRLDGGEQ